MKNIVSVSLIICVVTLSACASNAPHQTSTPYNNTYSQRSSLGTVESIHWIGNDRPSSGTGAVVGGIIGAIVGNQVGGDTGRTVATVAGGIGGAVIGNNVEKNRQDNYYQINIRMDDGGYWLRNQRGYNYEQARWEQNGDRWTMHRGKWRRGQSDRDRDGVNERNDRQPNNPRRH